jgi:hypothetical protein
MTIMRREGDVVLIYFQDQPAVFARIESIESDIKKGWCQVTLLLLTIPTQTVTWILRESYIDGALFTMGGRPMRIEEVKKVPPKRELEETDKEKEKKDTGKPGRVIPFKKP